MTNSKIAGQNLKYPLSGLTNQWKTWRVHVQRRMCDQKKEPGSEAFMMFVYGTLKRGQPNHRYLVDPATGQSELVGRGHTREKYPLVIAGNYNIPYLLYHPGDGYNVSGEIYKVDTQKRDFLDDFESHPTYYERSEDDIVMTDNNGETKTVKCWVYFLKNYKADMVKLTRWENYDSYGPHQLVYVERYQRARNSGYEDLQQAQEGHG